jgi:hypothetical protein
MEEPRTSRGRRMLWRAVLTAGLLVPGAAGAGLAQGHKVDLPALVQQTQKMSQSADEMTLVWWIPEEFWKASAAQNPNAGEGQAEDILKVVRPYTVVVVVDGKMGPFGAPAYRSEAEVRAALQIKDGEGTLYRPLGEDKLGGDVKNLMGMMKPVFVNMLGPMGENMHFFLFPAEGKNARKIAEAAKEGKFSVLLGEREFKWRLPLDALVPSKTCPTCGEKLSGAFKFCPWDGTKLPEAKK